MFRGLEVESWLLLFLVYGVDSVLTIAERLIRKENIFRAHRRHLYQLLSNELGWSHVSVSFLFAAVQALVNMVLAQAILMEWSTLQILLTFALTLGVVYFVVKALILRSLSRKEVHV